MRYDEILIAVLIAALVVLALAHGHLRGRHAKLKVCHRRVREERDQLRHAAWVRAQEPAIYNGQ